MRVKIINCIEDFAKIEGIWNSFYLSRNYTFFQSFNYNFYSWKNMLANDKNNILNIILISQKNILVAICPFYIDKFKRLRFINDIHTDFCDVLINKKFNLNETLIKSKKIGSLNFINLKKNSNLLKIINFKSFIYNYIKENETLYSYINLKKGVFPENHKILRSKQKSEFRRIFKKNKKSFHSILSFEKNNFPKQDILLLRKKMIDNKVRDNSFLSSELLKLIESLYYKNELIISLVKSDSNAQAISFILKKDNYYLFWIDMYDNSKMINIFNYIKFISKKSFIEEINMHFGRGNYFYKLNNFKPKIENLTHIYIYFSYIALIYHKIKLKIIYFLKKTYKIIFK